MDHELRTERAPAGLGASGDATPIPTALPPMS